MVTIPMIWLKVKNISYLVLVNYATKVTNNVQFFYMEGRKIWKHLFTSLRRGNMYTIKFNKLPSNDVCYIISKDE